MKSAAPPNFYVADVGSGSFRAGYSSEGGICIGVGNYPGEQASALPPMRVKSLVLPPKDLISEGKATLPRETHLEITPAPSDHGSSVSVDEAALPGRKRSFAEAIGADEGSQARLPAPTPQEFPPGLRGLTAAPIVKESRSILHSAVSDGYYPRRSAGP
jgi:hypothetical protein